MSETEIKFDFPYAEYVEAGLEMVPAAVRSVNGSDRLSDLQIAKTAMLTLRRIAPKFDPSKGVPWEAYVITTLKKDLRNAVERQRFVADEEIALVKIDAAWDAGL